MLRGAVRGARIVLSLSCSIAIAGRESAGGIRLIPTGDVLALHRRHGRLGRAIALRRMDRHGAAARGPRS